MKTKKPLGLLVWEPAEPQTLFSPEAERVLSNEMFRAGLDRLGAEIGVLWPEGEPVQADNPKLGPALRRLKDCRAVLVLGSQATGRLLGRSLEATAGLTLSSPFLPKVKVIPCPHPGQVAERTLGEFRLCLEKAKGVL